MRETVKLIALVPFAALALHAGGVANAQQSTDSIINALKPTGNLVGGSTRGIKLGANPGAQTPSASQRVSTSPSARGNHGAQHEASSASVTGPSINLTVNFPTGSSDLTPAAKASLDNLGKALESKDLAGFRFRIEGHTDNVGTKETNLTLSQRRADAVVSYLTTQFNVSATRLEAVGMGEDRPVVEAPPQTPEARNRRVQVINIGT